MTPGSTHVVRCPSCGQLGTYPSIASGNTFGAVYYTDGRRVAPMLPNTPSVVRCGGCSGVFWLASATEVGEYSPWGSDDESIDPTWTSAARLVEPDEQQYLAALEQLVGAQPQRSREARLIAWWRGNDRLRCQQPSGSNDTPQTISQRHANMRQLIALLDTAEPSDQLMRAEALRQLGEFEQATAILSKPFPPEYDTALSRLLGLCAQRNSMLQKL